MRVFLALLSFLALALAPLASPVVAKASAEHCAQMQSGGEHRPAKAPAKDKTCCHVVPAMSPDLNGTGMRPLQGSSEVAELVDCLSGRSHDAEDPPPRA